MQASPSNYKIELELIGKRLDAVRRVLAQQSKSKKKGWALSHWFRVEQHLLKKWSLLIYKIDSGITEVRSPEYQSYKIRYDYWEEGQDLGSPFWLMFFSKVSGSIDLRDRLNESWVKAKEDLLKRSRQDSVQTLV